MTAPDHDDDDVIVDDNDDANLVNYVGHKKCQLQWQNDKDSLLFCDDTVALKLADANRPSILVFFVSCFLFLSYFPAYFRDRSTLLVRGSTGARNFFFCHELLKSN